MCRPLQVHIFIIRVGVAAESALSNDHFVDMMLFNLQYLAVVVLVGFNGAGDAAPTIVEPFINNGTAVTVATNRLLNNSTIPSTLS